MPVFISHRTRDDEIARKVWGYLYHHHHISCYIDDFDEIARIAGNTNCITARILERLEDCTHLLALVTKNTRGSWWVPFEVGVARRAPRVISTYTNLNDSDLPEYLKEWPILRWSEELDEYAAFYHAYKDQTDRLFQEVVRLPNQRELTEHVHLELKTRLNQT